MEVAVSLESIIHALGIFQGVLLGTILLFVNRKNRSTLFLGLFLIGFGIEFLPLLIEELNARHPKAQFLVFVETVSWLLFPLFFIYLQKISIFSDHHIKYWILYPGLVSLLLQLVLYLLGDAIGTFLEEYYFFEVFLLSGLAYSVYFVILINKHVHKHNQEVRNQFALDNKRLLHWARFFAMFSLVLLAIRSVSYIIGDNPYMEMFVSGMNFIAIGFVAYCGLLQYNVFSVIDSTATIRPPNPDPQPSSDEKLKTIFQALEDYVDKTQIYRKEDLTIMEVAATLGEHPRTISKAINQESKKTFNSYINEFRVKKAMELLQTEYIRAISIEGLGREVGFHSKTSFYKYFKKYTGTTPRAYHQQAVSNSEQADAPKEPT